MAASIYAVRRRHAEALSRLARACSALADCEDPIALPGLECERAAAAEQVEAVKLELLALTARGRERN